MNKRPDWYIVFFIVVVLIQILFLNKLQFNGFLIPYFYVLFIMLMPVNIPRAMLLVLAFILGISIDIFSSTPGIHASATVLIAFIRPFMIDTSGIEDQEKGMIPSIQNFGFLWFLKYAVVLIIIHHFFLFFIEVFSFKAFFFTLLRSVLSSIFTLVLIVISQFLIYRK
ncbi:MAG: rod shape-determining protein MreD [Prolixibacteraceae bacterium]|nr:rod shape-determining protein MreD [Prolixibacteraceae bacterium]